MPNLPLPFPEKGIDRLLAFGQQRPGTTSVGTNVVAFEPSTDRARGGSRPGLAKYVAGQVPAGSRRIQNLNFVVSTDYPALTGYDDPPDLDPLTGLPPIDDPSDAGLPTSWGTQLFLDPGTGLPITNPVTGANASGADAQSRNPGSVAGRGYRPRKVRQGGSLAQPNKNVLHFAPATFSGRCFQGTLTIQVHVSPDPLGFDGSTPNFNGSVCTDYRPPLVVGPVTAGTTLLDGPVTLPNGAGVVAAGTPLVTVASLWLAAISSGATATVTVDLVSVPSSTACTHAGQTCGGAPTPSVVGNSVGSTITAA